MPETIQPHILVVDDDPQIRDLLKEYLAQNELRVSVTSTGREMSAILIQKSCPILSRLSGKRKWQMSIFS